MPITHETELYKPVKQLLEERGFEVKGEVKGCDLVAYLNGEDEPVIIEMKKSFNLSVVLQGMKRMKLSSRVYIAVERGKRSGSGARWSEIQELCRRLGLGLIGVTFYARKKPFAEVLCEPGDVPYGVRQARKARERMATEFAERSGDYNVGGATRVKLVTAYREKALECARCLAEHGPLPPRRVKEHTGVGIAAAILQRNVYGWFSRVQRGLYQLTAKGEAGLREFAAIPGRQDSLLQQHDVLQRE